MKWSRTRTHELHQYIMCMPLLVLVVSVGALSAASRVRMFMHARWVLLLHPYEAARKYPVADDERRMHCT